MSKLTIQAETYADAIKAYQNGENVIDFLRNQLQLDSNEPDIIELAYHLQSGTYIEFLINNTDLYSRYCLELAEVLAEYVTRESAFLDVGSGELTTIAGVLTHLPVAPCTTDVLDLSYARLQKGLQYFGNEQSKVVRGIRPVVGDMCRLPFKSKSFSVTTSSHALEPNGVHGYQILSELCRVTRDYLVLFEPCYEAGSNEVKSRMEKLGYIKAIPHMLHDIGCTLKHCFAINAVFNPLNPTYCYVIEVPRYNGVVVQDSIHSVPGSDFGLVTTMNGLYSSETGLLFPVINGIPVLRLEKATLVIQ